MPRTRPRPPSTRRPRKLREPTPIETVRRFIRRVNACDVVGLARLSGSGMRFLDAVGAEHTLGPEGWKAYFADFPDYHIGVRTIQSQGAAVAVFGVASGSFQGRGSGVAGAAWRVPAAWRAVVRDGRVVFWQVYCDVEPMRQSAGRGRSPGTQLDGGRNTDG